MTVCHCKSGSAISRSEFGWICNDCGGVWILNTAGVSAVGASGERAYKQALKKYQDECGETDV